VKGSALAPATLAADLAAVAATPAAAVGSTAGDASLRTAVHTSLAHLSSVAFGGADPGFLAGLLGVSEDTAALLPRAPTHPQTADLLQLDTGAASDAPRRTPAWLVALVALALP